MHCTCPLSGELRNLGVRGFESLPARQQNKVLLEQRSLKNTRKADRIELERWTLPGRARSQCNLPGFGASQFQRLDGDADLLVELVRSYYVELPR